eukprot:Em0016g621a
MAAEATDGLVPGLAEAPLGQPASAEQLRAYLLRVVPTLLEEDVLPDTSALDSVLKAAEQQEKKFISDPQERALFVLRTLPPEEEEGDGAGGDATPFKPSYMVDLGLNYYQSARASGVAFLKRGAIVEAAKSIRIQLRVINVSEDSPFETLHSYIKDAVTPLFNSYVQTAKKSGEGDKLVPSVQKKMNELEVSLLHLQQNIDIPDISLTINPDLQAIIQAAVGAGRRPTVEDFDSVVGDSSFLNALQKDVAKWIKEIQKVTKLDRDASSGTALQEISFWLNLETALAKIQAKRDSAEVTLTLDVLKAGKRFHATLSFDSDTGLKEAQDKVADYVVLMKDFPVNELLAANSMESIQVAVSAIYNHLKKLKNTQYPGNRAVQLIEAISRDLMGQLLKVLGTQKLMLVTYEEFDQVMSKAASVFATWDDEYDKFSNVLRDVAKRKREEGLKFTWRVNPAHKRLQDRITKMTDFRKQHEQLQAVILKVLRPMGSQSQSSQQSSGEATLETDDLASVREVRLAYENVKVVDCLDLSPEGCAAWDAALKRYDERIDRVETKIAARLRDQLGTAKNANEMFRIFSRFNALFVRAHIRGAIREYQTQLIQRVKEDIEGLHNKFKSQYSSTTNSRMCGVLDIPPVSSAIIWARQIDGQLQNYLQRVEDVLGKGWESHIDGQQLKQDGDSFRQKLNSQVLFDEWKKNVESKQHVVQGKIFQIASQRTRTGTILKLQVNFAPETITLAKEVRNLKWLDFRVPMAIGHLASQANQLYPHAVSLMESVRTYELTCEKINTHPIIGPLVALMKRDVQEFISEGCGLLWESFRLEGYVQKFSDCVFNFQEKVDEVMSYTSKIETLVSELENCEYSAPVFSKLLEQIQKIIDDLNLRSYSNLQTWVKRLDEQIEAKLIRRLSLAILAWTECLTGASTQQSTMVDMSMDTTPALAAPVVKLGGTPQLEPIHHELHITNQIMHLQPPVEIARCRPRGPAARVALHELSSIEATYRSLLGKLMQQMNKPLIDAYAAIENLLNGVNSYVKVWLQYQSLWDMEVGYVFGRLESDLTRWQRVLMDIKKSRKTIDNIEIMKRFGPVEIHYGNVQSKVNLKYDSWHREILSRFGTLLAQNMQEFHITISRSRTELENYSVDATTTSEAVGFITLMQDLKRKVRVWDTKIESFRGGEKILDRQRFQFPPDWIYIDHVEGEWGAFVEIMKRKDAAVQTQIGQLQAKIVAEDKVVELKTVELLQEWERGKPSQGEMRPDAATGILVMFETKFNRLKEDRDNLMKAKDALELLDTGMVSAKDERVLVALEELQDLKGVWVDLGKIWQNLDEMREKSWLSVAPRKIRQSLDTLLQQLKDFPSRLKQYASFEYVQRIVKTYTKVNVLVTELKSEALKERHWKQLMKKLNVNWMLHDLTLGQIWDVDLQKNEMVVRDVLLVAQGEMALEEFMKQIREQWQTYELELVNYQNKCKLIKGWDELFTKLKENINSLTAMKLSPYFKVFEDDALAWDDRLNRVNALFDVWIDVQRRWVYLEGIFAGSADIKHLLPNETQKFQSISAEFLGLMKKVSKSPLVLDVLNIPGVQKSLERLADLLSKIQKALGEYLERERASFPRFYFVGDEDLLEIIGNSKSVPRLQKHFKKMFAGVAAVILNEDGSKILGISSREGEQVLFKTPVSLIDNPKINQWLALVEKEMRLNLAMLLAQAVEDVLQFGTDAINIGQYLQWVDRYPAQLVVLASQIAWSGQVEAALVTLGNIPSPQDFSPLEKVVKTVETTLNVLADSVLQDQPAIRRKKLESLITELVHQRDMTRRLVTCRVSNPKSFEWLSQMRFYFDPKRSDVLQQLSICMANAEFNYGFEYLGVQDKLVQTPLTDRMYLTMTQALEERLGGSPFGPAGTGKTESVKALGNQLGRFVLVFNCDETFDFQAMGRIFVGLCQVGAWGCFDEFNRLEERMLSAVSQQVQTIQEALKEQGLQNDQSKPITVELVGKQVKVNPDMAIFITMNPGYAGRSNLPDNLKQLFRSLAMTKPDRQLIAQVMLYSQGFRTAERVATKVVPFFKLCDEQLSSQAHYDFGLRALKSVLISAGNIKRSRILRLKDGSAQSNDSTKTDTIAEQEILIQSVCETMVPKLVADDIPLLRSLLSDVFPGIPYVRAEMTALRAKICEVCQEMNLVFGENDAKGSLWVEKVLQLYQIQQIHHGLMMVGPSGSGKSMAWRVLLKALEKLEGVEGVAHIIDPKAISKESLYGVLDPNTREWTDGLFTFILRKIVDNVRGEINKRQWIIFDGDVDPDWVENLNSVLDDNKLLTLPNGERLALPPNVRIMFEVQDLGYATLATVSRCGMVWFSEDVLSLDMIFEQFLTRLRNTSIDEDEKQHKVVAGDQQQQQQQQQQQAETSSPNMQVQVDCANYLAEHFSPDGLVVRTLKYAESLDHIMDFTRLRALGSLFSMLHQMVRNVLNYNLAHSDFPMVSDQIERYVPRFLVYAIVWSFSGDGKMKNREEMGEFIRNTTTISLPPGNLPVIDYEVTIQGEWTPWMNKVPKIEVETHKVGHPDIVVPTLDTVRHETLLYTWLAEHKPLVLCGPPGSGKTMTLFAALRSLPDFEVVGLNFSSATTPELLLKTFDHYCEYKRTPNGVVMAPVQLGKWLVLFCDEINLPDQDKYGTQRVISFLRQIVEHGGFYRTTDQTWITLERIQFVGACNPPTDPGRKPLSHRFLRHVPVIYVDYPGPASLKQIYGTFNRAMLRLVPNLRTYADPLTEAMVEFYIMSQERFTQDMQPHYVYSPREMTRWVRGIHEALRPVETLPVEGLVRIWAHEALRLFQDRLIFDEERAWTDENINMVANKHFPSVDNKAALSRPILFSNWLSKDYTAVDQEELREYVQARLKVFYEEELDIPLVLFNEVLDHVLRIDRIFKQKQGHLLLIGVSGAGKTTLSRFVAWINGLSVFQIKVHNKYSAADFDEDLRTVLRRSGTKDEKIVFILDESNILDSGFLERMNTLLANGEVPGLFEGDEFTTLMTQCKEGSQKDGLLLDSSEELYKWFTDQVMRNLHVVFTMNPSSEGLKDRAATSPALFNRCVLNWFGDWSTNAFYQVGYEFTNKVDLDRSDYMPPVPYPLAYPELSQPPTHRQAIVNAFVYVHQTLYQANSRLLKRGGHTMAITPRHYLDFINHYVKLYNEKRRDLEEQQLHLNVGLQKIRETVDQVEELQASLSIKKAELQQKNDLANQKLKQMVKDQQEAERKRVTSQEIQETLQEKTKEIEKKRAIVMEDLGKVEPAVKEAQNAVKGIKKQHLVEVRALPNPPPVVKMAMESIALLLGEPSGDWKSIRAMLMKENFVPSIVNFATDKILPEVRERMKNEFLNDENYNFEAVNRASKACGPLVQWAVAQLSYSEMLNRVEPLRREMSSLENVAEVTRVKGEEINKIIQALETSIGKYKEEYAVLISQVNTIKADLVTVEAKVDRSKALLASLASERERWDAGSEAFRNQMSTISGDVLLTAAFMAYGGYFDQSFRHNLFTSWASHLQQAKINFRPDLARVEYLSTADERIKWQANALPSDDLCTENAIMIKRFNRYPLIIDPSGQATEFIMNEYKDKKITKTSFLDDAFRKNLESALRFGNPLFVQDVESYDPILNPVLNREVRRTGGRVLITLGDQDIDLSPSFVIFLATRDPSVEFAPDLCSRVTFVNFTVTRSSLQSQCLNQVLKAERPDVDAKRSDLLKLQGEFMLKLRHLEQSLLQALNEVKGRILDDDRIITQLESLKREAAEVQRKVEETDVVMAEVERVSLQYRPLSSSCSSIYFTLESLNQVHFLYQYSLQFFLDVFQCILNANPNLKGITDYTKRLNTITTDLFQMIYNRVARGMIHEDRIVLAILLSRIKLREVPGESSYNAEFDYFLRGKESIRMDIKVAEIRGLLREQVVAMTYLSKQVPAFAHLSHYISGDDSFLSWIQGVAPEQSVPVCWETEKELSPVGKALHQLLVIQAFRPDRLMAMATIFVTMAMGEAFQQQANVLDLAVVVENEIKANTPVLLSSVTGYDASGRVDDLAAQLKKQCTSIAIGSAEGFSLAEKAISSASKSGRWVLLKNVHLAPQWLVSLEKKLHSLTPHAAFRLFLTMEINPKVPVNLLRASRILTFEPPPGVKANLVRTFGTVPPARMCKEPTERARLYFLLAWFHAIIQERLRYAPLGWTKKYEFNDSDLKMACDTVDTWMEKVAQGRSNLPPDKIPWSAFCTLLSQCIYGGRIDNEFDQRLMNSFVNRLFTVKCFETDFHLMSNIDGQSSKHINMPEGIRRDQFLHWVENLAESQTPSWLGLPNNAEKVLLTTRGADMIGKLLKMQALDEDETISVSTTILDKSSDKSSQEGRPAWMRTLHTTAKEWLCVIPESLTVLKRTTENIKDPLFRFFERELNSGAGLLKDMRQDLNNVVAVCEARKKQTNYLRSLISDLAKGIIPKSWRRYTVPPGLTVMQFVTDFSERVKQLQLFSKQVESHGSKVLKSLQVWLGGLFTPEAYITATRQYVAQANNWSLEELFLDASVDVKGALDDCSFGVSGLKLQGAQCVNNTLTLATVILTDIPLTGLKWIRIDPAEMYKLSMSKVTIPVYLNHTRAELLFTLDFKAEGVSPSGDHAYYERGVALLASAL